MSKKTVLLAAVVLLVCAPGVFAQIGPLGEEFQVNTVTSSYQLGQDVGVSPVNGDFVVVWYDTSGSDGDSNGIAAARFASDGSPLGGEFIVNTYTTGTQKEPSVAVGSDGSMVVVWADYEYGHFAGQRFDSQGSQVGAVFEAAGQSAYVQRPASVVMTDDLGFVVVFAKHGALYSFDVAGRRFDSSASPVGDEFVVNTYTTSSQWGPEIDRASDGSFVVVWDSYQDGDSNSVHGQRFSSDGNPQGDEFQVNTYTTGRQRYSALTVDDDGSFLVAYSSAGGDGDSGAILAQAFNSAGAAVGSEFVVNSYTTGSQGSPAIARGGNGEFLVVWTTPDGSGDGIRAQVLDATRAPVGSEFQINSYTTGSQRALAAAADATGSNFVVTWSSWGSSGSDDSASSIQALLVTGPLFADGFESGDTQRWSATTP